MAQLERDIYVGGGMYFSSTVFCPIISKFDQDLALLWSYEMAGACDTTNSLAIDLLYADNINHKIYGVGVYRSNTAPFFEVIHSKIVLFITGHSETSNYVYQTAESNSGTCHGVVRYGHAGTN